MVSVKSWLTDWHSRTSVLRKWVADGRSHCRKTHSDRHC